MQTIDNGNEPAGWRGCVPALVMAALAGPALASPLPALSVPPGFRIELYADDLPDARSLARAPDGTVFVGSRRRGVVRALLDTDADGRPDQRRIIAAGLRMPNGIAYRDGDLYVAEVERIWRYPKILQRLNAPVRELLVDGLPPADHHGWRYLAFDREGWLYLSIGAPCNVCEPDRFGPGDAFETASIIRMRADGSQWQTVARGVRNSVGLAFDPADGRLWFTDNGRDWLGDDSPPCELNRAGEIGAHYGFPYCHGGRVPDPEFPGRCEDFVAPVLALGAHVAPLGLLIYDGAQFPAAYRGDVLIAEHGSWNRREKVGYRVIRVRRRGDTVIGHEPLVSGWLQGGEVLGRPVDLLALPDGSVLISDDHGGRLWRLSHVAAGD